MWFIFVLMIKPAGSFVMCQMKMRSILVVLYNLSMLIAEVMTKETNKTGVFDLKFTQDDYKLKYEWGEVINRNKAYVNQFDVHVFKYNRTTTAMNITYNYKADVGNEIDFVVQVYKFASNEYRLFPIRFQVNICVGLTKNLIGSRKMTHCGNFSGCPIVKDQTIHICNWAPDEKEFPPYIPTGKYMIELQGIYRNTEMWMGRGYGSIIRPIVPGVWGNI